VEREVGLIPRHRRGRGGILLGLGRGRGIGWGGGGVGSLVEAVEAVVTRAGWEGMGGRRIRLGGLGIMISSEL
jgi:hypothetical protein